MWYCMIRQKISCTGSKIPLRFLFDACTYLSPVAQTRRSLEQCAWWWQFACISWRKPHEYYMSYVQEVFLAVLWQYRNGSVSSQFPVNKCVCFCNISQVESSSVQGQKYLRGFRHEVQASCRHQAHCLRRSRVCANGSKQAHVTNRNRSVSENQFSIPGRLIQVSTQQVNSIFCSDKNVLCNLLYICMMLCISRYVAVVLLLAVEEVPVFQSR